MNNYPHLFSPITISGRTFKNRIFAAPASCHLLAGGTAPNEKVTAYYARKAAGGAAMINFSAQNIDTDRPYDPVHAGDDIFDIRNITQWKRLTDAVHAHDAYIGLELLQFHHHGYDSNGGLINYSVDGRIIDTVETMDRTETMPALPLPEMEKIADRYALAAERALDCGFDSIFIHGGHGVLLSQFISPLYNNRTDEFGGSAENRARFPLMILKRIRERVGDSILIEYRVSGDELAGLRGFTVDDCIDFTKRIQDYIDIIHVSAGSFMSDTENITHPVIYLEEGCLVKYASAVKACPDIHIPVLTIGALKTPAFMDGIIKDGHADLVAAARALIADPDLPNKARSGNTDKIIPCIRCLRCTDFITEKTFGCTVNPWTGREYETLHLL